MKNFILIFLLAGALSLNAQKHTLEKNWETDTIVAVPESVLPDLKSNTLYISLINGGGWNADGIGGIGKLSMDGKQYDSWVKCTEGHGHVRQQIVCRRYFPGGSH